MQAGRSWWRIGFAAVCIAWFVQKLHWSDPDNLWDFTVYYPSVQAWRAGLDSYDVSSLPPATVVVPGVRQVREAAAAR